LAPSSTRGQERDQERGQERGRLLLLTAVLFVAYLCVAIPLPIIPVYVTGQLGFSNLWAGLGVGIAFFSTVVARGYGGALSDRRGVKLAVSCGLAVYIAGTLVTALAGVLAATPATAFLVLLAGRLLLGVGESLVGIGISAWGVGLVGPERASGVLAMIGSAIYAALAVGGPLGLFLYGRFGFAGAMAISALLPGIGLLMIWRMSDLPAHSGAVRPPFWTVIGKIWWHGIVVCLQGIGFAAIGAFFVLYFLDRNWSHAGLGLTAFGTGFVLARLMLGRLPDRVGGLPVAIGSLAVEALGQALIWSATDPAIALAGAFLSGLGCSMVFPAMGREVVHLVAPHLRGTALGGYAAFQDVAYGLTGPLVGLLADRSGYGSIFLVGAIASVAGLVIAVLLQASTRSAARRPD